MICVLKHKKSGKYIASTIGKLKQEGFQLKWDDDKSKVQFKLTDNMLQARQIEDPDMNMVIGFGLEAVPLKLTKGTIERAYRIIEHEY
jgi:ABC-type uncharacterized transport system substrate-binding protein